MSGSIERQPNNRSWGESDRMVFICNALTISLTWNAGKDLVAEVTLWSRKNARSRGEQKVRHSIQLAHHAASVTWSSLPSALVCWRCRPFIILISSTQGPPWSILSLQSSGLFVAVILRLSSGFQSLRLLLKASKPVAVPWSQDIANYQLQTVARLQSRHVATGFKKCQVPLASGPAVRLRRMPCCYSTLYKNLVGIRLFPIWTGSGAEPNVLETELSDFRDWRFRRHRYPHRNLIVFSYSICFRCNLFRSSDVCLSL